MPHPFFHPQLDEFGNRIIISEPINSSEMQAWLNPHGIATYSVTDNKPLPAQLNGVAFKACIPPKQWEPSVGRYRVDEPPAPEHLGLLMTSGCVVMETDRRIWLAQPTNRFCSLLSTFPKGRLEPGLDLATNAVKETFEETGLLVSPSAYLCDIVRTKSVTRYYLACRIGGTPAAMGWETQAVSLMPPQSLRWALNAVNDRRVITFIEKWLRHSETP